MNKNLFYFLIILAMSGWGMFWVNAKVLSTYMDVYELIFMRAILSTVAIGFFLIINKIYFSINLKDFLLALLSAIIMLLYVRYFFLGTKFGTASLGGALVPSLIPINTFLIMAIFFGKKITKRIFFALLLGIIGILIILKIWTFSYQQIFTKYNQYFLLASISFPMLSILSNSVTKTPIITFIFYVYLISIILVMLFFDIKKLKYIHYDGIFWLNILGVGIFSTAFSNVVYFIAVKKLGTNQSNSFLFLVPIFAIFFSIIFLKERIELSTIIGGILAITSVKIINSKKSKKI